MDTAVVSEAQALLLNLEKMLIEHFGKEARLGNRLAVLLQLSEFHELSGIKNLKELQAQIPPDVMEFLNRHRRELPEETVRNFKYALPIFFVPVAANRERSAEAVVRFVQPGAVSPEIEEELQNLAVVTKPKRVPVASDNLTLPSEFVRRVRMQLPHRFTMDTHTRAWKYFGVRPPYESAEPAATDDRYCIYDALGSQYGYTDAWVKKFVRDLKNDATYREIADYRGG